MTRCYKDDSLTHKDGCGGMLAVRTVLKILGLLALWRVALVVVALLASSILAYKPSFPYALQYHLSSGLPHWIYSWSGFDGVHYITLATEGYEFAGLLQAFFPVYPLLVRLMSELSNTSILISGLIVSHIFFVGFILTLFTYVAQRFDEPTAWKVLLAVLAFPTSFFFVSMYSESLFLFLSVLAFLSARNSRWLLAGMLVALASATRIVGIFLVPALAIDLFFQHYSITRKTSPRQILEIALQFVKENLISLFAIGLGMIGLLSYMGYLWLTFQNPVLFFSVQSEFGASRQESIILLPQVLFRYLKILLTVDPTTLKYYSYVQDFILTLLALCAVGVGIVRRSLRIKVSELTFCLAVILLPTLTGTLSSMPRYVLVCFPLFIILPQFLRVRWQFATYLLISSVFLIINVILFVQGYWVA